MRKEKEDRQQQRQQYMPRKRVDSTFDWVRREEKAQRVIENMGVKLHRFLPSSREIWTVVGREGDFIVSDPGAGRKPYCSCDDFHFRVIGGAVSECYHLIAAKRAIEEGQYAKVEFIDEEYEPFLRALISDVFSNIA